MTMMIRMTPEPKSPPILPYASRSLQNPPVSRDESTSWAGAIGDLLVTPLTWLEIGLNTVVALLEAFV